MRRWIAAIAALVFMALCPIEEQVDARDQSGALKASELIGKKVQDVDGKKLGDIKDLVIEPGDGNIAYAVLDFGGFLGIGDKYFAVPWEALELSEDQRSFILDVKKKDLKNAPGFDKKNWPDMSDLNWTVTIYDFYEVPMPNPPSKSDGGKNKDRRH